ncbi:RNA polymerase sigma factor [Thermostilla marina]
MVSESSAQQIALRDPDVRLMLEVAQDDPRAFEELVLRYQSRVVAILQHLVGNRHQAEDLAQDVFLRVYRARKRYKPTARFSTWLYTIVNNVASNAMRSRNRRREVGLKLNTDESGQMQTVDDVIQASSGVMPARNLDRAEIRDVVRLALEELNERQRLAVLLSKFEGMSYADIGAALGMSPKAVKSLMTRARTKLKEVLEPYLETGRLPIVRQSSDSEP